MTNICPLHFTERAGVLHSVIASGTRMYKFGPLSSEFPVTNMFAIDKGVLSSLHTVYVDLQAFARYCPDVDMPVA